VTGRLKQQKNKHTSLLIQLLFRQCFVIKVHDVGNSTKLRGLATAGIKF